MRNNAFHKARFYRLMQELHPTLEVLDDYVDARTTKIRFKCLDCGRIWKTLPSHVIGYRRFGCDHCSKVASALKRRTDAWAKQEDKLRKQLDGTETKILYRIDVDYFQLECKCGRTWKAFRSSIMSYVAGGCKLCSAKAAGLRKTEETISKLMGTGKYRYIKPIASNNLRVEVGCACGEVFNTSIASMRGNKPQCQSCATKKTLAANKRVQKTYTYRGRVFNVTGYEPEALDLLIKGLKIRASEITDVPPTVKYRYNNKTHTYVPDLMVVSTNTIVEVKSPYTFGLKGTMFGRNVLSILKAKARAVHQEGYQFMVILIAKHKGDTLRIVLPQDWYKQPAARLRKEVSAYFQGIIDGEIDSPYIGFS